MNKNIWKGVLIEESLADKSILSKIKIVRTKTTILESEKNRGEFHFHRVEVKEVVLNEVVKFIATHIASRWYCHLVRDEEMIVIFANKIFKIKKGDLDRIEEVRSFGIAQGIKKEQLGLEYLFVNPFG